MPKASKLFQALAKLMNSAPFNLPSRAAKKVLKKNPDENEMEEGGWHRVNTGALLTTLDPTNPLLSSPHPVRSCSLALEASTALQSAKGYPANTFTLSRWVLRFH